MAVVESRFSHAVAEATSEMEELLIEWASINSGSDSEGGLLRMLESIERAFGRLPVVIERVLCPGYVSAAVGSGFSRYALRVRPAHLGENVKPILLNGHYDTVYGPNHSFQKVERLSDNRLRGPGVTDMKGGLVILLTALKILESSELAGKIPWEVLITPDEETGSEASGPLLREAAERCRFGLVYESAYVDGGFVRSRKGSAVYTIEAQGKPAHVGRNYEDGRNAILGLSQLCLSLQELADDWGVIANVGRFKAESPLNVVADYAACSWNVRAGRIEDFDAFERVLDALVEGEPSGHAAGIKFSWSGGVSRPPKEVDDATQMLYDAVEKVASEMGLPVLWRDTGGGSDGSNLAAYGLPNIDNLGARGGAIHSDEEFIELDSLTERVSLTLGIFEAFAEGSFYS